MILLVIPENKVSENNDVAHYKLKLCSLYFYNSGMFGSITFKIKGGVRFDYLIYAVSGTIRLTINSQNLLEINIFLTLRLDFIFILLIH